MNAKIVGSEVASFAIRGELNFVCDPAPTQVANLKLHQHERNHVLRLSPSYVLSTKLFLEHVTNYMMIITVYGLLQHAITPFSLSNMAGLLKVLPNNECVLDLGSGMFASTWAAGQASLCAVKYIVKTDLSKARDQGMSHA